MSRVKYQRELAQKIVTAIGEVDFAKERYKWMQQEEADERKAIIDGKLKPKGEALLKKWRIPIWYCNCYQSAVGAVE